MTFLTTYLRRIKDICRHNFVRQRFERKLSKMTLQEKIEQLFTQTEFDAANRETFTTNSKLNG
jgi:hypothetical protein